MKWLIGAVAVAIIAAAYYTVNFNLDPSFANLELEEEEEYYL